MYVSVGGGEARQTGGRAVHTQEAELSALCSVRLFMTDKNANTRSEQRKCCARRERFFVTVDTARVRWATATQAVASTAAAR